LVEEGMQGAIRLPRRCHRYPRVGPSIFEPRVPGELQLRLEVSAPQVTHRNMDVGRRRRIGSLVVAGLYRVELIAAGAIRKGQPLQIAAGSRLISDNRAVFPIAVGLQGPDGDT